ncbi:MAG: biopolymer transporter ExbD [Spirochaetota bacterium]|nr:biopolymer transporter ExbD [Spirochaetota bacterium]
MDRNNIILQLIRRHKKQKLLNEHKAFESTSIGDLAFLLLIFFIVTGSFVIRQGIFFSLPSRSAGSIKLEEKFIIEVYPLNNGFQYNGDILDREAFKKILIDHKKEAINIVIIILMQPDVKYDHLVDTLSLAKETGIKRVSLKNIGTE